MRIVTNKELSSYKVLPFDLYTENKGKILEAGEVLTPGKLIMLKNYVKIYTEEFGSEEESEGKVEAENGTPSQLLNFSYEGIDAADFETVINKDAYVKTEIQVKIKYFYKRILDLLIQGYYEEALFKLNTLVGVLKTEVFKQVGKSGKGSKIRFLGEYELCHPLNVAVISGLAEQNKYDVIKNILVSKYQSSTYMERYVLEALCKMGYIEEAQERIKVRYEEMVNGENACSTLWETWVYEAGTKNHAWSGGPLVIMSKYFAGIEPLKSGYEEISIKPQFGNLTQIFANTDTIKGEITLYAEKFAESIYMNVDVPEKTRIAIPKFEENLKIIVNGKTVYKKGKPKKNKIAEYYSEDEKYFYFYVEAGEYEIQAINVR